MLTKGTFTRDEWNRLLRLFNISHFSMFSWSHFLPNRKQSAMSKRAQTRKLEEGPAVAKPRSACLVSRNLLSAMPTSSWHSGASYGPGNQELGRNSVFVCARKPARDRVQNPATNSQEWQEEENPLPGTGKLVGGVVCVFSGRRETCTRYREPTCKDTVGLPPSANLGRSKPWESLREPSTEVESFGGCRDVSSKDRCVDLGIFSFQQRCRPHCILGNITMIIWFSTGTPISKSSRRCSTSRRGWSWNRTSRFWMFPRLNGHSLHGWDPLCYMTQLSSGRKQKYTSTQIRSYVWERFTSIQTRTQNGKINFIISNRPTNSKIYVESMEIHLSSSGIFSQDTQRWEILQEISRRTGRLSSTSKEIWRSSRLQCRCSTMLIGQRKDMLQNAFFEIPNRSGITQKRSPRGPLAVPRPRTRRTIVWNAHRQGSFSGDMDVLLLIQLTTSTSAQLSCTRGTLGECLRFLVVMSIILAVFPLRCRVTSWLVKPTYLDTARSWPDHKLCGAAVSEIWRHFRINSCIQFCSKDCWRSRQENLRFFCSRKWTCDGNVCNELFGCSVISRENKLLRLRMSLWVYVKSSEEGILKVVVYVARSVSSVFDVNVMSWTIWNAARDLDKVSKPRCALARHRLSTDTTYTTSINRMNGSSTIHTLLLRSALRAVTFASKKGLRDLRQRSDFSASQNEIRDGGWKARSVGLTCFLS